jgi:hypothetical protein
MARTIKVTPLGLSDGFDRFIMKQYRLFKAKKITGIKVPFEGDEIIPVRIRKKALCSNIR